MSKFKPFRSFCALMLALCMGFGTLPAFAQSQASTGQIAGQVVDSQGAGVAKATVKTVNTQTGLDQTVTTDDEGLYKFVLLPPGIYTVTVDASGFSSVTAEKVEVVVGRTVDVNLTVGVSGVQETVNVSAGAVQVQTTRSEADAVINETAIQNLPINGRRFQDFVTLTPTAQVESRRGQISLAGQRGINGNISVDGADYNNPFFGGIRGGERANFAPTIPQESIKEFQVVASGYTAEFGRSTGGIVNAVTKSGTNDLHGSAFFLARPKQLGLDNLFIDEVEFQTRQTRIGGGQVDNNIYAAPTQYQWGGSVGGPIIENKLFFFGAYEQQRVRISRAVLFSNLTSFTPGANQLEAFNFYRSLEEPYTQTNDSRVLLGRIDYEINDQHRANVRYNFSDLEQLNAVSTGNQLFPTINNALSNNGTEKDRTHTVVGQMASFLSPTLVNELRVQYSRERRPRIANEEQVTVNSSIGNFGTVDFLGQNNQTDWRFQLADNMTWSRGNHTFKFGGEWNHVFAEQLFGFDQFGTFFFRTNDTARLLDILTYSPNFTPPTGTTTVVNRLDSSDVRYSRQVGNLQVDLATEEIAFFGQDSWRIRPNFTFNYGLRWESQFNPTPDTSNTALVDLVRGVTFPGGSAFAGGIAFPEGFTVDPTQLPDDLNQFGPRVGFAWDPFKDGKTVVRGYGGLYYARTPLLLLTDALNNWRNPPGNLRVSLPIIVPGNPNDTVYEQLLLIGINLNNFSLGNLPILSIEQVQEIAAKLGLDPLTAGAQPQAFAEDFRNPRSFQLGFGIEREVMRGFTLGADYIHVKTEFLQRNRDVNVPNPQILATTALNDLARRPNYGLVALGSSAVRNTRPIASLGQVQLRESSAESAYDAMTLRAKYQRSWAQFNVFYTLSKSLSDDDNERSSGGFQYDDPFNLNPEYNYSELDRRHQFVASPVFFLPWGFDVSSAIRLRSGRPIDARAGVDLNQDNVNNDRPYFGPGVPFQRNQFRNRALYDVDLRVQKRVNFSEDYRLVLSAEVFNVFNLTNIELSGSAVTNYCSPTPTFGSNCGFTGPTNPNFLSLRERRPGNAAFGRLLTNNLPGNPFQVQLGARFQF